MALYKPTELRQFLDELGIRPKKSLSQNFLIDGNIIRQILTAAEVKEGDLVVEIGPGPGALTEALLESGARVLAIEKDDTYARELTRLNPSGERLHVIHGDAMTVDIETPLAQMGGKKAKLIANLPYHLTTPLLARFIEMETLFTSLHVMVQEEVARRMTARAGGADYGSLTLFLDFYSTLHYSFFVSRKCFFPSPKVDSAVVSLFLHPPMLEGKEEVTAFFKLTRRTFEQRRKMVRSSLKGLYPPEKVMGALETLGLNPLCRPEELSLDNFLDLYRLLHSP